MKHICLTHHHQRKVGELAGEDVGFGGEVELGGVTGQSAASPAMTSGQGSQPVDNSLLAQKMTALNIASAALDNKLKAAQIQGVKEENKGKSLDNRLKSREVSTEDALSMLLGSSLGSDTQVMASKLPFRAYQEYMRLYRDWETDRKSTRLNSSHSGESRMPSSA